MTFKQFLKEGGNVFGDKTSSIKLENIDPTLSSYFSELKRLFPKKANIFNSEHFKALGSVGKKPESGDIDLGVDSSSIVDKNFPDKNIIEWNLDPKLVKKEFELLKSRAKTSSHEQLMMKAFLIELSKYINKNAPKLHIDEKKITPGNLFGLYPQIDKNGKELGIDIQIDWMIGNLKWLHFSYYSAAYPKGSNVKGLHRTQGILAAFQVADLSFNHVSGVKEKSTGKVIATDPDRALNVLSERLGLNFTKDNTENYYKLFDELKKLPKEKFDKWIDIYLKILDSTRADIPDNLQDEWRNRKDRLGLQGKFLPDDSKLKELN